MPRGSDDNPKVFDVSKPNKTTPSASSRPIIVGHHPIMADPMVLEERYHHPKPLHPRSSEPEETQTSQPITLENPPRRTSISPLSSSQTLTESAAGKAYTTYGTPTERPSGQSADDMFTAPAQASLPTPIFEASTPMDVNQKPIAGIPTEPQQQPLPENLLQVPAGAASKEHARNQIGLALILLVVIALMAFLAIRYLLK